MVLVVARTYAKSCQLQGGGRNGWNGEGGQREEGWMVWPQLGSRPGDTGAHNILSPFLILLTEDIFDTMRLKGLTLQQEDRSPLTVRGSPVAKIPLQLAALVGQSPADSQY